VTLEHSSNKFRLEVCSTAHLKFELYSALYVADEETNRLVVGILRFCF